MVDYGTDIFGFHDNRDEVVRIQVKTAQGTRYANGGGYRVQFAVPMRQLRRPDIPPLVFALVARVQGKWEDVLVISRKKLNELWNGAQPFGTEDSASGDLKLGVQFRPNGVTCSGVSLDGYKNAWETLPPLRPILAL
jgi:hypothetical protein